MSYYCYRYYTNRCYMSYYCYTSCFVNYCDSCLMNLSHYPSYCCSVSCYGLRLMPMSCECCWDDCMQSQCCCYESCSDEHTHRVSYHL